MRVFLLLILVMPSLVHAQVGDGVAVCCGATRPNLGRNDGFAGNLPPLDSRRFGQQFSGRDLQLPQAHHTPHEPEASYGAPWGLYNMDEGGYNPGTGVAPRSGLYIWQPTEEGWASNSEISKYYELKSRAKPRGK